MPSAATEFVQLILSRGGSPSAVAVTFQNQSSLPPDSQEALQNAIFNAFRNANVRLVKAEQAVADVQITFSEDWQGYVWIANIQQGSSSQLVIKKLPRQQRSPSSRTPTLTIRKISVWQQDAPILDFYQDNQNLLVLEPGQLSLYSSDSGQWRPRQTLGIPHQHPWPRDVRGRLEVRGGEISAFLPGARCSGKISPPSLECRASDDPWPLDQGQLVAFFSRAQKFLQRSSRRTKRGRFRGAVLLRSNMAGRRPALLAFHRHRRPHAAFSKRSRLTRGNVQRLGKHAGRGPFDLRVRLAAVDQRTHRHNPAGQHSGS